MSINQELFLLANRQDQMKIWNVKLNIIEQIRVRDFDKKFYYLTFFVLVKRNIWFNSISLLSSTRFEFNESSYWNKIELYYFKRN